MTPEQAKLILDKDGMQALIDAITNEVDLEYAGKMLSHMRYDFTGKRNIEQDTAEPGERVATV